jgi:hypothetical protein
MHELPSSSIAETALSFSLACAALSSSVAVSAKARVSLLHESLSPLVGSSVPSSVASLEYSVAWGWTVSQAGASCFKELVSDFCKSLGRLPMTDIIALILGFDGGAPPAVGPAFPVTFGEGVVAISFGFSSPHPERAKKIVSEADNAIAPHSLMIIWQTFRG